MTSKSQKVTSKFKSQNKFKRFFVNTIKQLKILQEKPPKRTPKKINNKKTTTTIGSCCSEPKSSYLQNRDLTQNPQTQTHIVTSQIAES